MKTFIQFVLLGCFMILLTMDSCAWLTGDVCDDTIITFEEPIIYLKLHITNENGPDVNHITTYADKALVTGSITKFYCGGKKSGSFSFNHTLLLLKDYSVQYLSDGVFLSQPYQFKFTNSEDYLEVILQIKLYFDDDGKIFESTAGTTKYYYADISYDVNRMDKFINLYLPVPRGWKDVTK